MSRSSGKATEDGDAQSEVDGLSFESALEQLEGTVGRLEAGDMPLEEALDLFESGVQLSRRCSATLDAAEQRVEMLVADRADAGNPVVEDFETDDEEDFED